MTVLSRLFHREERSLGNDGFYVARDTENNSVFVIHKWSQVCGDGAQNNAARLELATFLQRKSAAQASLIDMIGSLASTEDIPW